MCVVCRQTKSSVIIPLLMYCLSSMAPLSLAGYSFNTCKKQTCTNQGNSRKTDSQVASASWAVLIFLSNCSFDM